MQTKVFAAAVQLEAGIETVFPSESLTVTAPTGDAVPAYGIRTVTVVVAAPYVPLPVAVSPVVAAAFPIVIVPVPELPP